MLVIPSIGCSQFICSNKRSFGRKFKLRWVAVVQRCIVCVVILFWSLPFSLWISSSSSRERDDKGTFHGEEVSGPLGDGKWIDQKSNMWLLGSLKELLALSDCELEGKSVSIILWFSLAMELHICRCGGRQRVGFDQDWGLSNIVWWERPNEWLTMELKLGRKGS